MLPQLSDKKSGFPYLVDCKLTSICPFNCNFCYTSSTENGNKADSYFLYSLGEMLYRANVFEVNFGGGEPTLYKDDYGHRFNYLSSFKSNKFKIGITTKNYKWHLSELFEENIASFNSVAVSANSLADLSNCEDLFKGIREKSKWKTEPYLQCIFGLVPYEEFQKFVLKVAEFGQNLTLLGYKDFGFGKSWTKYQYPKEWIGFIKKVSEENRMKIGIDSVMVREWKNDLIDFGIKDYYLVGTEGKSSCYIDAVQQKMYSSSFSDEKGIPINREMLRSEKLFLEAFSKF